MCTAWSLGLEDPLLSYFPKEQLVCLLTERLADRGSGWWRVALTSDGARCVVSGAGELGVEDLLVPQL